jgi:glucose-6-phosphate isomerase
LAFRLLKTQLEEQQGKAQAQKLIIAITDRSKGALRKLAEQEGYKTFVIEDNIGGRYSVLTPVGLLPIATAGFDIRQLVAGAAFMESYCGVETPFEKNLAAQYAVVRNELYQQKGKKIEILVNFHPKLHYVLNGGNNFMEKAKERITREFSLLQSILLLTCILWDNGYRKEKEVFLKRLFPSKSLIT